MDTWSIRKKQSQTKPNKPKSNPILANKTPIRTQFKPKQTQFQRKTMTNLTINTRPKSKTDFISSWMATPYVKKQTTFWDIISHMILSFSESTSHTLTTFSNLPSSGSKLVSKLGISKSLSLLNTTLFFWGNRAT